MMRVLKKVFWSLPLPYAVLLRANAEVKQTYRALRNSWCMQTILELAGRSTTFGPTKASPIKDVSTEFATSIRVATSRSPVVSIIIPVQGKIQSTLHCLWSIQQNAPDCQIEIIVIDDGAVEHTAQLLKCVDGIRVLRNDKNAGCLESCNQAASAASGDFLHFLNNDTEVHDGWLDSLLVTFKSVAGAGIVGSKLIFPNGNLQEAGALVLSDGSAETRGAQGNPHSPEYNYLCDVDHCSGASILIDRLLFNQCGGFDQRYAPAYHAYADLACQVRKAGKRVLYQPLSLVTHFGGAPGGTEVMAGARAFPLKDSRIFREKWREVLEEQAAAQRYAADAKLPSLKKRVLLFDGSTPRPDEDSASIDTVNWARIFIALGFKVTFLPQDLEHRGRYTKALQGIGVECQYGPFVKSVGSYLKSAGDTFDLVFLQRVHFANQHIANVKRYCSKAKVVFNTVDLHFMREEREAALLESALLSRRAAQTKALEKSLAHQADATVVISHQELEFVQREWPLVTVAEIPFVREIQATPSRFEDTKDIFFLGGFNHAPNVDAVRYFVSDIWPAIREKLPAVQLHLIGSNMPKEIQDMESIPGVNPVGYLEDLSPVLERCRLSIAPLRFGAGIKGKIGTSLTQGVPCVATALAAEGMGLTDNINIRIADDAKAFAEAVVGLYQSQEQWERMASNGIEHFAREYSFDRAVARVKELTERLLSPDSNKS